MTDQDEAVCKWVYEQIGGVPDRPGSYVAHGYLNPEGFLVAGLVYENFMGAGMSSEISVTAIEKCGWYDDQTRWEAANFAFNVQKVDILRCKVAETNTICIPFCEGFGMKLKHRIEKAHTDGDLLIYEMRIEDAQQHLDKYDPEWYGLLIEEQKEELEAHG
jgi:hypothetical protein